MRNATGAYDPSVQSEKFEKVIQHHYRVNDHHWNHWLNPEQEDGTPDARPMPAVAIREMGVDIEGWYWQNKKTMILHAETKKGIGSVLLEM